MFFTELRQTIAPDRAGPHGLLPPLLLAMTLVTGLVDAFSYLVLGHVFVANMTGNVVFLAFALVGAPGFSIGASLAALASFGVGAGVGGRVASTRPDDRGQLLRTGTTIQAVFVASSVALAGLSGPALAGSWRYALIAVLGASMGIQNATARTLAVPDLTTTVLTLTITGIAADSSVAGGRGATAGRRLLAVAAMFAGALVGAVLIVHGQKVYPLAIALAVAAVVAWTSRSAGPDRVS
ncbi:MAG TPA: YoaK family protein [Acidimicrobiales bacterium]|nr:YoaK family protein [Acidimicrobiales bacterium]